MPKNIVILADGTGQDGGRGHSTNVYRTFSLLEDRSPHQIAFYDRGIGTGFGVVSKLVALGTGHGFGQNVRECYQFIFERFEAGDRLFLIGFSRGAATVRALSYFIHLFGVLPQSRPELIRQAWRIYEIGDVKKREDQAAEFISRHTTIWTRVHFLGCYDTVAALGLPWQSASAVLDRIPRFRHRFHSFTLSPSVEHAYQALAIDDERLTFHPVLWDPEVLPYQTVQQVWFAGAHTDVGGGYPEPELSGIPLVWLTRKAVQHGLRVYPSHRVEIREDIEGVMHDPCAGGWQRLYRRKPRAWPAETHGPPVIHESVFARRTACDGRSPYRPWILENRAGGEFVVEPWVAHAQTPLGTQVERRRGERLVAEILADVPPARGAVPTQPSPGE